MTRLLGPDSSRAGKRGDLFYTDAWLIYGRIGQEVAAEVPNATFDSVLYLVSSDGKVVAFDDDGGPDGNGRIRATLPSTGLYRLEVSAFGPLTGGAYVLRLQGCESPPSGR
jgi:hypothetical protein